MRKATGDPLVGTTVSHYDVEARLGGGGMGVVYAARDTKLGRRVALKFLPPQWSHDESAKQRFIREAQAASATDHPNICTIHEIGTAADGQLFIVMAHYDGETLKTRLERGRLPVDEAVDIAAQVAEGLAKAHSQGVVHRDIKPGNLMLTENGVKILDFGLAKFADARLQLTIEGSTLGTIAYMSPEQARGEEADARSDVWAVGVVLYEMLTGGVPFRGGYPEAISYAIKNDRPAPIRATVPEVSETLEQLVFRALHKEPAVRLQSARDLARALRLLQGRSLPPDLRTEPLTIDPIPIPIPPRWWRSRRAVGFAAVATAIMIGAPLWVFAPVDPLPIAVGPVVNQTGYAELDAYRMALTQELVAQLDEARPIRVLSYDRLLEIVRGFRARGDDVSGRQAMQALAQQSGATVIVVPTLVNDGGSWKARVEFRNAATANSDASWESAAVVSSLPKEVVYGLMPVVARAIQDHFIQVGPRRAYVAERLRALAGQSSQSGGTTFRTLDAAAGLERGRDAFAQQEYSAALAAFTIATETDPRSALAFAWRSQAARVLRRDQESVENAEAAERLLRAETRPRDRLFVEATAAEARQDAQLAEARYSAIVNRADGDASALWQMAAFLERQGRAADAVAAHHRALAVDSRALQPHLDLCRLYNPRELATARQQGTMALEGYRAVGDRAGEGHALWCLVDVLRLGTAEERGQGRHHAAAALAIFEDLNFPYNTTRAHNYVALAAWAAGDLAEAEAAWGRALAGAQVVGNRVLEPLVMMNLGVTQGRLGHRARQLEYLNRSSALFQALGQQQRAAEVEANAAALLIAYAGQPEEGLRRLQNAMQVARKLGNTSYEAFAGRMTAAYYHFAGRTADAARELNRTLALAKERDLQDRIPVLTADLASVRFDEGDYTTARTLLVGVAENTASPPPIEVRMTLARVHVRLGAFEAARQQLDLAARDIESGRADPEFLPQLHAVDGELSYEMGNLVDARAKFERSAALWTDQLPDPFSVEARAYIGLLDAVGRRLQNGRADLRVSLDQARKMGRLALEARCRVYLARIDVAERKYDDALKMLDQVPADDPSRTIGPELQAQALYWRSRALAGLADPRTAADAERARRIISDLQAQIPESSRARFVSRPDLRQIIG